MPRLRRLCDPQRRPGLHAGARPLARADRLRIGDRVRCALPVLPADLRDAFDSRARACDRDRTRGDAAGSLRLGRDRRRRRALDRRESPDPRAAPERQPQDPPLQQPHLRAHEGPVLADVGARQGDEVDAHGLARLSVQPALRRDRRRGVVRRARDRHGQEGSHRRPRGSCTAPRVGVRRDPPELQHLQRRRLRLRARGEREPHLPRGRRADPVRRGGGEGPRPVPGRDAARGRRCRSGRELAPRPRRGEPAGEPRVRALAHHVRHRRGGAARRLPQRASGRSTTSS